jgi:release factor glutamine methyltransferase
MPTYMANILQKIINKVVTVFYKPLLSVYLKKPRQWQYKSIRVFVPAGVFHPAFFYSTKILLKHVIAMPLQSKKVAEVGCGTGIVSIACAQKGALVTAVDINKLAVDACKQNSMNNKAHVDVYYSDLFADIPLEVYDYILVNPPYYKKPAITAEQYAWYAGENYEYFQKFFAQSATYTHSGSYIIMIVSEYCHLTLIQQFAENYSFKIFDKKTIKKLTENLLLITFKKN